MISGLLNKHVQDFSFSVTSRLLNDPLVATMGDSDRQQKLLFPAFGSLNALFRNEWHFPRGCSHTRPTEMHLTPPAALFHFVSHERFTKAQSTWTWLLHIRINSSTKPDDKLKWGSDRSALQSRDVLPPSAAAPPSCLTGTVTTCFFFEMGLDSFFTAMWL